MGICMSLMERDYPKLAIEDRSMITKQIRAGYLFLSAVLFEPPMDFGICLRTSSTTSAPARRSPARPASPSPATRPRRTTGAPPS